MSTTVTITIAEQRATIFGTVLPKTEITVTRGSKPAAIAEAIAMVAAAHRPELEQAWADLRAQVEPLLETYRAAAKDAEEQAEQSPATD